MMNRVFSTIRDYNNNNNISNIRRTCKECGQLATKDALFDVGNGIAVIERYCDQCVETVNRSSA